MSENSVERELLLQSIHLLEDKWVPLLTNECKRLFAGVFLPSHDCSHHTRVWNYAKQIILSPYSGISTLTPGEAEILLLACFFHDTGMSINTGLRHGTISKKLCAAFLERTDSFIPMTDILLSIVEEHDVKDDTEVYREKDTRNRLLALLHMADDFDAFGAMGIYRYTEIYLVRGTPAEKIPEKILPNLENRFARIRRMLPEKSDLLTVHARRFLYTRNFFRQCVNSLAAMDGFLILSHQITSLILNQKQQPEKLASEIIQQPGIPSFVQKWARNFILEIS